jgi:hypothetical protein
MRKSNIVYALRPRRRKPLPAAQTAIETPTRIVTARKPKPQNRQITGHNGGPGTVNEHPRAFFLKMMQPPGE